MPREIFTAAATGEQKAAQEEGMMAKPQQEVKREEVDALAGALPDWDLLPMSPFVRRIK